MNLAFRSGTRARSFRSPRKCPALGLGPGLAATCSTNSGNILRQEGFGGAAWDYTYDSLNRMQSATERVSNTAQWQQTYRYDAVGNRALINAPVGTTPAFIPYLNSTPVVSSTSEPMPFSDKNRWSLAAYDLAGNQTTAFGDGTGVGSAAYAYDAENRMIRADPQFPTAPSTSGSILYGYDGDGRRVTKSILQTVNNSPVYVLNNVWVYDALGQLAAEYGESPTMPCTTCYVTADHLGSTRVIWDSAGTIKKLTDYAPFGEEIPSAFRGNDSRYPGALYPRTGG